MAVRVNRWRAALPGIAIRAAILALLLLLVVAFLAPPDAQAGFLGLPSAGEIVQKGVKGAFDFVIKTLFGGIPTAITETLITWQLHLPSDAFTSSNVAQLERTSAAAAFALLSLVMTASALRYWLAGITDGGTGAEAFMGIVRSLMAALAILAWPWFFDAAITVTNQLTHALIHSHSVHDDVSRMLGSAVGIGVLGSRGGHAIPMLIAIILVVGGTVLMLALLALHIVLTCALVVMFVGGPLVIVLTPFPATAWMARLAFRAFATLLAWPVLWALCFAAFAAVFQDFVNFKGDGGFLSKLLLKPLTGCGMLYLCVKLPMLATRASMMGVGGGMSFAGFAARSIAVRQIGNGISSMLGGDGSATPDRRRYSADAIGPPIGGEQASAAGAAAPAATAAAATAAAGPAAGAAAGAATATAARTGAAAARRAATGAATTTTAGGGSEALRTFAPRAAQLREQMWQNRREGAQHSLPAGSERLSANDVARSLARLGPDRAAALQNAHQRAMQDGERPDRVLGAVTRAASYGAARAEQDGDRDAARDYMVVGSASGRSLDHGMAAYAAQQPTSTSAATPATAAPSLPAAAVANSPSAGAPPSTSAAPPDAAAPATPSPAPDTPRRSPHKP